VTPRPYPTLNVGVGDSHVRSRRGRQGQRDCDLGHFSVGNALIARLERASRLHGHVVVDSNGSPLRTAESWLLRNQWFR